MQFNLVHCFVGPRLHGFSGFAEVVETVRWGLAELGHDVIVQMNRIEPSRRNIIFGYQLISAEAFAALPADTIIYNFEQMANVPPELFRPQVRMAAEKLQIWDYCQGNLPTWAAIGTKLPPIFVPVGWSPTIAKIPKREQDIDVLFYGAPGAQRLQIFGDVASRGLIAMYVCGLYGQARDELIARSRVILNLSRLEATRVFESVRVSYLLANGKAVVSDLHPDSIIEPDFRDAVAFASPDQIAPVCVRLIEDTALRSQIESLGPQVMQRRDIRKILATALSRS